MAGHGTIDQRPSTMSKPTTPTDPEDWTGKNRDDFEPPEFRLVCPFSIPSSPEAASLRIIRNLGHFALYYTHFVWLVLFITLIPQRKVSLVYLVIMTYVASLYLLLLRALPPYFHLLHKIIYKSMVLGLIAVATMIELIATAAGLHLVITLAATVPIVLIHAVLWVREDFFVEERTGGGGGGELVSLFFFFFDSKRDNYILIKQPHQVSGAERKIEYNGNMKKEKTKVMRDLIS